MPQQSLSQPVSIINSTAPIRICDNGGWTDTWFAGHGKIFNIGVRPCVEVQLAVYPRAARAEQVLIHAENYGESYAITPGQAGVEQHALLVATIAELAPPEDVAVEITIFSDTPAGCSTGTSAAVTVALIGALDRLTPGRMTPHEVAYTAHRIEVERLKLQSGIQDQLCSAYGGINYIEMVAYPHATVSQIKLADAVRWELERRLLLIFLGKTHSSSAVHEKVIAQLEREGSDSPRLNVLRRMAEQARDAVCAGDFAALGRAMANNTAAQGELHPELISADARALIELAQAHGALGWKVNGAGGTGGSVTLLCDASASARRSLVRAISVTHALFRVIPITLSQTGLRVWEG